MKPTNSDLLHCVILDYDTVQPGTWLSKFLRIIMFPSLVQNFKYLGGKYCAWCVQSECVEILTCRWKCLTFSTLYIKHKITTWEVLLLLLVHKGSEDIFFVEEKLLIFKQNHRHSSYVLYRCLYSSFLHHMSLSHLRLSVQSNTLHSLSALYGFSSEPT